MNGKLCVFSSFLAASLSLLFLLISLVVFPPPAPSEIADCARMRGVPFNLAGRHQKDISFPADEIFEYDVRFLWFMKAATSRLQIRRVSGRQYRADMVAETKGIIGFLSAYRKNYYASEMEYVPEKGRLIPHRFTRIVVWGSDVKKTTSENDYERGEHRWVHIDNGKIKKTGREPIPPEAVYEDLLSAFFNLRNGAFGPLRRGRRITVTSQPYRRTPWAEADEVKWDFTRFFVIRIADLPTEQKYRIRFGREKEKGLLLLVNVPSDFFGQNTGDVLVWLNEQFIPVAARVEDVILFGDVCGTLRNRPIKRPSEAAVARGRDAG